MDKQRENCKFKPAASTVLFSISAVVNHIYVVEFATNAHTGVAAMDKKFPTPTNFISKTSRFSNFVIFSLYVYVVIIKFTCNIFKAVCLRADFVRISIYL